MIMLGTKSPRLGWASALGTLSFSALLLPLSPTWAQKAEQKPRTDAFYYQVEANNEAKPVDTQTFARVVVVNSDNDVLKIQADSLDQAVELITQKIEAIAKQGVASGSQAAQISSLETALFELQRAKAKAASPSQNKELADQVHKIILQQVESGTTSKLTAEQRAQIDKARSRVDALRKELDEKRKQLTDAQTELNKLVGPGVQIELHLSQPQLRQTIVRTPLHLGVKAEPVSPRPGQSHGTSTLSQSDKDRLDSLEKQLTKVLDELARMKKHEEGSN